MSDASLTTHYSGEIFDLWETYHKVVVADFMAHRAIGAEVEHALTECFEGRPFAVLDLGCGDASVIAPILRRHPASRYAGVDLSAKALEFAAQNLQGLPCPVSLTQGDILEALTGAESADILHCSFVLHHLPTQEKAEFFKRSSQRLARDGALLLVDTVRDEDETLPAYLENYCSWIERDWPGLTRAEKDAIYDHIRSSDRPETLVTLDALAQDAGLIRLAGNGKHHWHRLMRYVVA